MINRGMERRPENRGCIHVHVHVYVHMYMYMCICTCTCTYLGRTESTLYACVWLCPISGEWAGEATMHMRNCHNYDIRTTTPQIE